MKSTFEYIKTNAVSIKTKRVVTKQAMQLFVVILVILYNFHFEEASLSLQIKKLV